jgi:ABC-type uncharacterized transport system substrate-binding protein
MAADLVRRQVAAIVANSPAAVAAKAATTTIPIIFTTAGDPVELGLIASLNRPGGNITGVTQLGVEVGPKRLELLRELIPTATIMASLVHPTNPNAETISRNLQSAARTLGLQIHVLYASTERDIDDPPIPHHVRAQAPGKIASRKIVCSCERVRRFLSAIFSVRHPRKTPPGLVSHQSG